MSGAPGGFSIVVPAHRRVGLAAELLRSLDGARAAYDGPSEVILVDSSDEPAAARLAELCRTHDARYLRGENHVGRKRNLGLAAAVYDTVFFIDSDCRADPRALAEHQETYAATPDAGGVLGLTEWDGPAGRVWRVLDLASSMTAAFRFAAWFKEVPWGPCTNLSIRRDALLAVGGFDEQFPLPVYGEDVDLGVRLTKAGYRLVTNPRAVVHHTRAGLNTFPAALRKSLKTGRADYHLGHRHPERLVAEYPGPLAVALLLAVLGTVVWLVRQMTLGPIVPFAYLFSYLFLLATLTAIQQRLGWSKVLPFVGVALLEMAFECGRLFEVARHGGARRLWTKFVYVDVQLLAERDRRIVQSWSIFISMALMLLLLQVRL